MAAWEVLYSIVFIASTHCKVNENSTSEMFNVTMKIEISEVWKEIVIHEDMSSISKSH